MSDQRTNVCMEIDNSFFTYGFKFREGNNTIHLPFVHPSPVAVMMMMMMMMVSSASQLDSPDRLLLRHHPSFERSSISPKQGKRESASEQACL